MKKIIIFIFLNVLVFGLVGAKSRLEIRRELSSIAQDSVREKSKNEDVGEWKDIAIDVLFALLRKTEIYRGQQNLYVIDESEASLAIYPDGSIFINTGLFEYKQELHILEDKEVSCAMFPDGSVFISTGLFEYIDEILFLTLLTSENVRKAKNLNLEREAFLAPFIAFEVARFALDIDVNNFIANKKNIPPFSL